MSSFTFQRYLQCYSYYLLSVQYFCDVVSALLINPLLFGFIKFFSSFSSAMFYISFYYSLLVSFFPRGPKISSVIQFCFVFLLTLGICSTATSVTATYLLIVGQLPHLLKLQIYFEQPHNTFIKGSGWVLIKPS